MTTPPLAGASPVALDAPARLPLEHLEHQITELAAHMAAAACRWLLLVAEFDRRGAWAGWGCRSCAHWLSWRCSVAPSAAREHVRVARRLVELAQVREAFAGGELSYSKVRAITRVATPATESALVDMARHSTAAQLEKVVRAYRGVAAAELDAANAAHARRFLSWSWEDDGTLSIRGRLSPEDGVAFVAAVEGEVAADARAAAVEAKGASAEAFMAGEGSRASAGAPPGFAAVGGSADEDAAAEAEQPQQAGRGARAADALARLVEVARRDPAAGGSNANPSQVVLHVDVETLGGAEIHDRCELEAGPAVPPEGARRHSCDAAVVAVRHARGRPLDVGRRTRTIHPAMRRALEARDRGCAFPGCGRRHRLHAHHLVHWVRGGRTDLDNLVLLCPFHHRLVHEGGFGAARDAGAVRFTRPDGTFIPQIPPPLEGRAEDMAKANADAGAVIDARTCIPRWFGERLDLHAAVSVLCEREDRE